MAALRELGAERVLLAGATLEHVPVGEYEAILDLLGNSRLRASLPLAVPGGRVCLAGFLGGLAPLEAFNPLADMPSTVQLSFFGSFNFGEPGHEMRSIPYQEMADGMASGQLRGRPAQVFAFADIRAAHSLMEQGAAHGKLVVQLP